jgi:transposase
MRRYELTDSQFAVIADLMPASGRRGGQWNDHRTTPNGILWVLHTGSQWRELPERYGNWKSVHDRLTRWRRDGTIDRILGRLHLRLSDRGLIDTDLWCVDATNIRASRSAAGAGGRGGKGGRRAVRPRRRPEPRRVRDEVEPGYRRPRAAARVRGGRRAGPRVEAVGAGAGGGAGPAVRARAAPRTGSSWAGGRCPRAATRSRRSRTCWRRRTWRARW